MHAMTRAVLAFAAAAALLGAGPARAAPPAGWTPDIAAAREYAATRPGDVAFAVRTEAGFWGAGEDRAFPSASVLKAMLLVAVVREARDRPLRADERALLRPMIRSSANGPANTLFTRVGTSGLRRLARTAGMTRFTPASPIWGNSRITARDQTRFFLRLETLLPARHRAYALDLLRQIAPSQRWGIGRLPLPGWLVHFKGGWGSGTGAVDHQVALLIRGDERVAVAVLTADNGSHAAGRATLEGVFRRLLRPLLTDGHQLLTDGQQPAMLSACCSPPGPRASSSSSPPSPRSRSSRCSCGDCRCNAAKPRPAPPQRCSCASSCCSSPRWRRSTSR